MNRFTKNELIVLLKNNSAFQPKAKYSNEVLIQMLKKLPDNFIAEVEPTKTAFPINRGSLCEAILKAMVYGVKDVSKSNHHESDLDTSSLSSTQLELVNNIKSTNIEIKFSTSFAPATRKTSKAHKTIIVCENGIYMIDSKNIVATKAGKININNQHYKDLTPLTNLMNVLGFNA